MAYPIFVSMNHTGRAFNAWTLGPLAVLRLKREFWVDVPISCEVFRAYGQAGESRNGRS